MFRIPALIAALFLLALPANARCTGTNLLENLAPEYRAELDAALAGHPFATGNLWRATRGDQLLHIVGTYHLGDSRHAATLARLAPLIATATTLLVEAGPDEERALKRAIAESPSLLFLTEGPSLLEQLAPEDWQALSAAMRARGIPSVMAAKFRPWYIAVMLGVPPCDMAAAASGEGLDHLLMQSAEAQGVPIRALEPHDTLFALFDVLSVEDQLGMIRATLLLENRAQDFSVTLADAYFGEDSRRMWEFMRLESARLPGYDSAMADAEFARLEELIMARRNRAWIPVIEAAASDGPAVAAFGALHLAGEQGVLALLQREGWRIERLTP